MYKDIPGILSGRSTSSDAAAPSAPPPVSAVPPAPANAPGTGTVEISPDAVKAAGAAAAALSADVAGVCKPAGDDTRAAAGGLSGWETQSALQYVADKIDRQSARLVQLLSETGDNLAKSAGSWVATDNRAAQEAGGGS